MTDAEVDAEVERILAMTDQEVLEDAVARGVDIELEVAKHRAMFEIALMRVKRGEIR